MPLTDNQRAEVRAEIGDATPPTDADLDTMYDRLGTVGGVIYEVTSKRLADLLQNPAQLTIPGELSQNNSANISAYKELLEKYAHAAPDAAANVVEIFRPTRRWKR